MRVLLLPAILLVSSPLAADTLPSQVTLPLGEYEALRKAQEGASVTVVDTLRLGGSFRGRDLTIAFAGRAAGRLPAEAVLAHAEGVVLYGCSGEGIVSRGESEAFKLTPLAPRFEVRCRIAARGSDRLELAATSAVLWVESAVSDGELVLGEEQDGGRLFSVVRRTAVAAEGLKPTATARYRLSLRPDETRFRYEIQVHNPNRSRQAFDVTLASGEHVQQVDAGAPYDVQGTRYRFELPPGESALALSGTLAQGRFVPPVDASLQYCLLESHPLLRPLVAGERKRVSPQEVGMAAEYRGAQAFLLGGGEELAWTVTRLEALRTTSYAVPHAAHTFFISTDGPVLGQSKLTLDNQGSPDVSLPMAGEPTFASLQGDPVLLTKDAKGDLWLPIAQGGQELLVQYREPYRRFPGLARATLPLPQVPVPSSIGIVEIRYPEDWFPLYEGFLSDGRFWTPDAGMVIGAALLFLWTERVLWFLGLRGRRRLALAGAAVFAGLAWGWALLALCLGAGAVTLAAAVAWIRQRQLAAPVVIGLAVAAGLVLFFAMVAVPSLLRARVSSLPAREYDSVPSTLPAASPAATARGRDQALQAPEAGRGDNEPTSAYQGLPARFVLPEGVHRTVFSREMLETRTPRAAHVWMVSRTALGWLQGVVVLLAAAALAAARRELGEGWRARWADARQPAAAGTGVA
ncbi:MAG TPA: hypothetical protein VF310_06825 [Vicinamibacteria bacterium]